MLPKDKHLCHACVGNEYFKDIIQTDGSASNCSYCGKQNKCLSLQQISKPVDDIYKETFEPSVDAETLFNPSTGEREYEYPGDSPDYLIQELLECEPEIADDLVDVLEDYDEIDARDGGQPYYDRTSNYKRIRHYQYWRPDEWIAFCKKVKHVQRYFNEDVLSELNEHFENINGALSEYGETAVIEIGPGTIIDTIYRARKVEDDDTRTKISENPSQQLGPPPASITPPGRMNPAGIPVFYGALEGHTCIAEIRSSVGAPAAIGKFIIKRKLKILDLTVFNEGFLEPGLYSFIVSFHKDISKPILPRDEGLDYIPTQVITEFLANHPDLGFDGIIYSSAQTDEEGKNIVLFNQTIRDNIDNTLEFVGDSLELVEIKSIRYKYEPI